MKHKTLRSLRALSLTVSVSFGRVIYVVVILPFLFAACAPTPKPNPDAQIQLAVAQTFAAIPTYTSYPTPRILPTATPASLAGLFCEYQFCIGHPASIALWDLDAERNPQSPSSISQGMLIAYEPGVAVIEVIWQDATGASDASFMLNTIIASDSRSGSLKAFQSGSLNVDYVAITTTATPSLPNGGAAAWTCGGRAFAWKAYTPQAELAANLLNEALQKFRCSP
jgi:hypothetical protein